MTVDTLRNQQTITVVSPKIILDFDRDIHQFLPTNTAMLLTNRPTVQLKKKIYNELSIEVKVNCLELHGGTLCQFNHI